MMPPPPSRPPLAALDAATLGMNLRAVWAAPTTDARLKKRIVRTVIHELVADIDDKASEIVLLIPERRTTLPPPRDHRSGASTRSHRLR